MVILALGVMGYRSWVTDLSLLARRGFYDAFRFEVGGTVQSARIYFNRNWRESIFITRTVARFDSPLFPVGRNIADLNVDFDYNLEHDLTLNKLYPTAFKVAYIHVNCDSDL